MPAARPINRVPRPRWTWKLRKGSGFFDPEPLSKHLWFWESSVVAWDGDGRIFLIDPSSGKDKEVRDGAAGVLGEPTWSTVECTDKVFLQAGYERAIGTRLFQVDSRGVRRELLRIPDKGAISVGNRSVYFLGQHQFRCCHFEDGRVDCSMESDYRQSGLVLRRVGSYLVGTEDISGPPPRLGLVIVELSTGRIHARIDHDAGFAALESSSTHGSLLLCPLKSEEVASKIAVINVAMGKVVRVLEDPPTTSPIYIFQGRAYWNAPSAKDSESPAGDLVAFDPTSMSVVARIPAPLDYVHIFLASGSRLFLGGHGLACVHPGDLNAEWSFRDPRFWVTAIAVSDRFLVCQTDPEKMDRLHGFRLDDLWKASGGKLYPAALRSADEQETPSKRELSGLHPEAALATRAKKALVAFAGTTLLPPGSEKDHVAAIAAGVEQEGVVRPVPDGARWDVLLLSFINPRIIRVPDLETIDSAGSWKDFLDPILGATGKTVGVTGYDSHFDADRGLTEVTLAWGAEEHRFQFTQDSDRANLEGLVSGLNRFTQETGFKYHVIEGADPLVGFLSSKEAVFLRKMGLEI